MKKNIYFLVILVLSYLSIYVPNMFGLSFSPAQSATFGIFIMAVLLWVTEAVQLYITSFLILFTEVVFLFPLLSAEGKMKTASGFYLPFFSDIIALFLGGLILAKAGSKYRIDQLVSQSVLRYAGRRADHVLLALMTSSAILSMWMSNTATTAMLLIIATRLIKNFENQPDIASAFLLAIPFAANLGGMATPVGTPPNAIALAEIARHTGKAISFSAWMIAMLPLVIILVFSLWVLLKTMYPLKSIFIEMQDQSEVPIVFNAQVISVIVVFAITVILWFVSDSLGGVSSGMIALIPVIIFLSFGLLDKADFKSISWDVLFLVGGGGSLSVALTASGLGEKVISILPLGGWSPSLVIIFFMLVAAVMTTFMSNTATANILIPLILALSNTESINIAIIATVVISSTMILPVSTPPNALAYSSGLVSSRQMTKVGSLLAIFSMLLFYFIGHYWWKFLNLI